MFPSSLRSFLVVLTCMPSIYLWDPLQAILVNHWAEIILYILLLFPMVLVIFDSFFRLLFLVIAHLPNSGNIQESAQSKNLRLLVLIVARNEQSVIEQTLSKLKDQADADDSIRITVLADHCLDRTAQIADEMGAQVCLRHNGNPGKAESLSWFAEKETEVLGNIDVVAILDADTLIESEFCNNIRAAFRPGVDVAQAYVNPVSHDGFPLTTLAAFSEVLAQKIDDSARSRLGWSVPLKGFGMAFRSNIFIQFCNELGTQVDDIELSVRLAEQKISTRFWPQARVTDPKETNMFGLARQRGRWLKGQRQVWTRMKKQMRRLVCIGFPGWSLIHGDLLKPKTALLLVKLSLVYILTQQLFNPKISNILLAVVLGCVLIDLVYYLVGLRYSSNPWKVLFAFLGAPLLVGLWILSWGFSMWPNQGWLRARKN